MRIKGYIAEILLISGIAFIVLNCWMLLEVIIIGSVNPNKVDNVVGIVLIYSLYGNFKNWIKGNSKNEI